MNLLLTAQAWPLLAVSISTNRTWSVVVWSGLALLAVVMLVLMATRWGEARPVSKCVGLSVFAHLLFLFYAWETRLIVPSLGDGREQIIRLAVLDESDAVLPSEPPPEQAPPEPPTTERPVAPDRSDLMIDSASTPAAPLAVPPLLPNDPAPSSIEAVAPPEAAPPPTPEISPPVADAAPTAPPKTPPEPPTELPIEPLDVAALSAALAEIEQFVPADSEPAPPEPTTPPEPAAPPEQAALPTIPVAIAAGDLARPSADSPANSPTDAPAAASAPTSPPVRPANQTPLPEVYRHRSAPDRLRLVEQAGGDADTEAAVAAALAWLARSQSADGHWDAAHFGAGRETRTLGHNRQGAGARADTGITGLALLAFLGAGHTHYAGPYARNVQLGLEYLLSVQAADGNLAGHAELFARMYCHGIATLAVGEALALTGDERLTPFVQRAVDYTVRAQDPVTGGWRYLPGDSGDTSQFGWQVMALHSAELAGIAVPAETKVRMTRFLTSVSAGRLRGLAAYRPGERPTASMTAEALYCRYLLATPPSAEARHEAAELLLRDLPTGDPRPSFYYWYYGTLALFQVGDEHWPAWNDALKRELLQRQVRQGDDAGSWRPETMWGGYGGQVYATAVAALSLEVYYRYARAHER